MTKKTLALASHAFIPTPAVVVTDAHALFCPAAAKNGAMTAVSRILASGSPADATVVPPQCVSAISASSPLYWAALHGHLGVARLLVLYGADPQWRDAGG